MSRFSEEMYAWRMARIKQTADDYAQLPGPFRAMLAKAAQIAPDRQGMRLDELNEDERKALYDALRRLRRYADAALPLLVQATPPSLPV